MQPILTAVVKSRQLASTLMPISNKGQIMSSTEHQRLLLHFLHLHHEGMKRIPDYLQAGKMPNLCNVLCSLKPVDKSLLVRYHCTHLIIVAHPTLLPCSTATRDAVVCLGVQLPNLSFSLKSFHIMINA